MAAETATATASVSRRRSRQRGAAAVELAVSFLLLLPLTFGLIDYGYYFHISTKAAEATRVASRATAMTAVGICTNLAGVAAAQAAGTAAATNYMTQIGMGGTSNLFVTIACQPAPPATMSPLWNVTVEVHFPPVVGYIRSLMKASTRTTGWTYYQETIVVLGN